MNPVAARPADGAPRPAPALPSLAVCALALCGAGAAWALSAAPPSLPGPQLLARPATLLAAFDGLWLAALVVPSGATPRARAARCVALLVAAAPFHAALAAAAGGGTGHALATATVLLAACAAALVGAASVPYAVGVALLNLAWPLACYALEDFARVEDAAAWGRASPLLALVLAARSAPVSGLSAAAPAAAGCALVALGAAALRRRAARSSAAALVLVALALAPAADAVAAPPASEARVLPDGLVRAGRPVCVRVPGAARVRARGAPWSLAGGARGDEFLLVGAVPQADVLEIEVADDLGRAESLTLPVRTLPEGRVCTAVIAPAHVAAPDEYAVRTDALPTLREGWAAVDAIRGDATTLPPPERDALAAAAPRPFPFEPARLVPSPAPFRAADRAAEDAPPVPPSVARLLAVLAAAEVLVAVLFRRARRASRRDLTLAAALPLAALAWLTATAALPGPLRAIAVVLSGEADALVLVRVHAVRDGTLTVTPPAGAGVVSVLRWEAGDGSADGVEVGALARLELAAGTSRVIAYRVPLGDRATRGTRPAPAAAAAVARALDDWLAAAQLEARPAPALPGGCLPEAGGAPVRAAASLDLRRRDMK